MDYRAKASKKCPYLLETTPEPHYAGFMYRAAEIVLINRFGLKNIPRGAFWKMTETTTDITDAFNTFKQGWGLFRILGTLKKHGHSEDCILIMLRSRNIKFPTMKYIGSYKFWCQKEQETLTKVTNLRYTKEEPIVADEPIIEIEKKEDVSLRDWLE